MPGLKIELVDSLFEQLAERGMNPRRGVNAGTGVADIVTDEAAYEVVAIASADVIRAAVPRLIAHRDAINPKIKAIIYGGRPDKDPTAAIEAASHWGVTVQLVNDIEQSDAA